MQRITFSSINHAMSPHRKYLGLRGVQHGQGALRVVAQWLLGNVYLPRNVTRPPARGRVWVWPRHKCGVPYFWMYSWISLTRALSGRSVNHAFTPNADAGITSSSLIANRPYVF